MRQKTNRFWKEKVLASLERGESSLFLDPPMLRTMLNLLPKASYQVWEPFRESDYKIIYRDRVPGVCCFKIICERELTHPMIMGSLYALNIESEYIGDIVVDDDYYFYIISHLKDYVMHHLTMIGSNVIKLIEVDLDVLKDYERTYHEQEILVPSIRVDVVLSKLAHTSRRIVKEKLLNEEVTLNYEVVRNGALELKENDIFSMRKCGKFRFLGIKGKTKKGNMVLKIQQF